MEEWSLRKWRRKTRCRRTQWRSGGKTDRKEGSVGGVIKWKEDDRIQG